MKLAGKLALVTGSGRGIGRGCALEIARQGANVVINDRPNSPDLEKTAEDIRAMGRMCTPIPADVFSRDGCEELVSRTIEAVTKIDILVSNPAASIRGDFLDYDPDDFDRVIGGALTSGFHMSQLVARHMIERGSIERGSIERGCGGKIVFISSVHASMSYARSVAYNAAKSGLNHMARTIAAELTGHRINVNVIEPGWIDTPGERQHFGDDVVQREGAKLPWGRLGKPEDIGKAATFLCSEDADYITGAVLRVDGGFVLKDLGGGSIDTSNEGSNG